MESQEFLELESVAQALTFRRLTSDQWQMWRAVMRRQPQWFILRKSHSRNDRWRAIAGPYSAPDDARSALALLNVPATTRHDRAPFHWQVASLTETMRIYHGNVPLLVEDLCESEARTEQPALHEMAESAAR